MKKHTLVLFMLIFSFGLFNFNLSSARASTINTLKPSVTKLLNLRMESPGDPGRLYGYPAGQIDPYTAEFVGNNVFSVKSWTNPVLIMDKNKYLGGTGARWFSLADPLNPTEDVSKRVGIAYWYCGDAGGAHYARSLSYSRDARYLVGNIYNCGGQASTPEYPDYDVVFPTGYEANAANIISFNDNRFDDTYGLFDMFQSNTHVYYTSSGSGGVYRLDGIKKVGADWVYPDVPDTAPNIPTAAKSSSTTTGVYTTVMAGTKDYVAVLTGPGDWRFVTPNKLSIYNAGDSSPVAEIAVNNVPANILYVQNLTSFVTSDVQYVMFTTMLPQLPISPTLSYDDPQREQNLLYVYKFDPATNTLTKVVEGIKVVGQTSTGMNNYAIAGIRVGNQDGVIMLLHDSKNDDAPLKLGESAYPHWKPRVFMFSDLTAGILKNVFKDTGYNGYSIVPNYLGDGGGPWMASLNRGDSTYVYLNTTSGTSDPINGIAVLRFDPSGVNVGETPPPATCQDSTSLNFGGTLPCRYPPTPRPPCSPGDSFNTTTGLPCGGATGTGRKLSCVNLSSNFYCSYTSDTVVTATPPTPLPPVLPPNPPPNPPPAVASCSLKSPLVAFEPNPPGVIRPTNLHASMSGVLSLYSSGGQPRMLMGEGFGYSVLDLSNPINPTALLYNDMRFADNIPCGGDGQSYIAGLGVSEDGIRGVFSINGCGTPGSNTVVGSSSGNGFKLTGDYEPSGQSGVVVQKSGSRYIAYTLRFDSMSAADITTLPASLQEANMTSENVSGGTGYGLQLAGNYLVFWSGGIVQILDASNPGPIGNISGSYPRYQITSADLGGHSIALASFSAAVDPSDSTKLWVLIELSGAPEPSYALVSLKNGVKSVIGTPFNIPVASGETWQPAGSSALVASGTNLYVFMWGMRTSPSYVYRLFSTSVSSWGKTPGQLDVDPATYTRFNVGRQMKGATGTNNDIYLYMPTGNSAYVLPMSCGTSTTPYTPPSGFSCTGTIPAGNSACPGTGSNLTGNKPYSSVAACSTNQNDKCEYYPVTPPPSASGCYYNAPAGLPACNNGCYVPQGGPSGGGPLDYWKCVLNGPFTQTLKLGSTGNEVVALQKFLNTAGYDCGTADGNFGPKTQAAVKAFQIANGLVGDGIVGPATRAVLNK
jgi:hypothetical protein